MADLIKGLQEVQHAYICLETVLHAGHHIVHELDKLRLAGAPLSEPVL